MGWAANWIFILYSKNVDILECFYKFRKLDWALWISNCWFTYQILSKKTRTTGGGQRRSQRSSRVGGKVTLGEMHKLGGMN